MRTSKLLFIVMILAVPARDVLACQMPEGATWLGTNKPVLGGGVTLTSKFGPLFHPLLQEMKMHSGIDWGASLGSPVVAAARGEIVSAGRQGYNGNTIIIGHGNGRQTLYAHLSEFMASIGDCVEIGTAIGKVGATGLASGPVLHFEVLINGQAVDPLAVPTKSIPDSLQPL